MKVFMLRDKSNIYYIIIFSYCPVSLYLLALPMTKLIKMYLSLQDHLHEVLSKWESIDDEIWAKIIVLERNRRVAKAYARAPVLTVNGTDDGFDGFRIGLAGFENPMRDPKTEEAKRLIGQVNMCNVSYCRGLFMYYPILLRCYVLKGNLC